MTDPEQGRRLGRAWSGKPRAARCLLGALIGGLLVGGPLAAGAAAQPAPSPPVVLDGPSSAIAGPVGLGMAIGRDGNGGVVYLKQVGGAEHVFVSTITGGQFGAPQQLDATLASASSEPVIAAGPGGLLVVAFVNGGQLYEVTRTGLAADWLPATLLASGASHPAIQMTYLGKAYVAFTMADGSGYDIRAAYYNKGVWSLEGAPLNNTPRDDAGTGSGRPAVAAAGDGVGIVAWGEGGHVYTRRVWGTSPSIVIGRADGPPAGCTEISADEPGIGSGGDSSYAAVSFHEVASCNGVTSSRVLYNRLHASTYDGVSQSDGLSAVAADTADQPGVTVGEYGHGWVTSSRGVSHDVLGEFVGDNASAGAVLQINQEPNASAPDPVPATAGLYSNLIAWQHDPGGGAGTDIRARYATSGGYSLGPEMTLSSPAQGPSDAAYGLAAGGDINGDAAVAWVQGTAGSAEIVAARLYQTPAPVTAASTFRYVRSARVVLAWTPQRASWGPITYTVKVDGAVIGQTQATAIAVPYLGNGRHSWWLVATNPAGLTSTMAAAQVFVDTVPPRVSFRLSGNRRAGSTLHISVKATDAPPGVPASRASGVAKVTVYWGDHSPHVVIPRRGSHVYQHPGRFKVRVVVVDRAGNTTTVSRMVKIASQPKRGATAPKKG